eukprot:SAG11_NODE_3723_length_2260_cov_24.008329_3_plen_344_part_00
MSLGVVAVPRRLDESNTFAAFGTKLLARLRTQLICASKAAAVARRTNPMQPRYSDTWDAELIFHRLKKLYLEGLRFETVIENGETIVGCKVGSLRAIAHLLLMLMRAARSDDASKIPFGFVSEDQNGGLFGDPVSGIITDVRYRRNKTVRSRAGNFSNAQPLGDYLAVPNGEPWVSVFCVRRAFEAYYRRTKDLPRGVGDQGFRMFFVHVSKSSGEFLPIGANTVANERGRFMVDAGVPARLKPHSGRHASFACQRADAPGDEASFLLSVNLSGPIYQRHYRVPVVTMKEPVVRLFPKKGQDGSVAAQPAGADGDADLSVQQSSVASAVEVTSAGSNLPVQVE